VKTIPGLCEASLAAIQSGQTAPALALVEQSSGVQELLVAQPPKP